MKENNSKDKPLDLLSWMTILHIKQVNGHMERKFFIKKSYLPILIQKIPMIL